MQPIPEVFTLQGEVLIPQEGEAPTRQSVVVATIPLEGEEEEEMEGTQVVPTHLRKINQHKPA